MATVTDVASPSLDLAPAIEEAETKGERTRRRLLEIAVERFGSRGYRSTSVSEIARAAGLTQAAAYAYFDSKEALFQAAVDQDASSMIDQVAAQITDTPLDVLVPLLVFHAHTLLDEHPLARRVIAGQEPEETVRLVELPALHRFSALLAERLSEGQSTGTLPDTFSADEVANGIEALVLGLLFSMVQSGGTATPRHGRGVVAAFELMFRPPC